MSSNKTFIDTNLEIINKVGWIPTGVSPFYQNIEEVIINQGLANEERFPPTFKWQSRFLFIHLNSIDNGFGENFLLTLAFEKAEVIDGKVDLNILQEKLRGMFQTLESYRLCKCSLESTCSDHT